MSMEKLICYCTTAALLAFTGPSMAGWQSRRKHPSGPLLGIESDAGWPTRPSASPLVQSAGGRCEERCFRKWNVCAVCALMDDGGREGEQCMTGALRRVCAALIRVLSHRTHPP